MHVCVHRFRGDTGLLRRAVGAVFRSLVRGAQSLLVKRTHEIPHDPRSRVGISGRYS